MHTVVVGMGKHDFPLRVFRKASQSKRDLSEILKGHDDNDDDKYQALP